MVKVKICGITNFGDAVASVGAGCDALGFVFYKKSPRYISPQKARSIIKFLPKSVTKIGVFVNAREGSIKRIFKDCKLDVLQFHGDETPDFCDKFKDYRIIKAFRVKEKMDAARLMEYKTFAYMFDTFAKSSIGGTGSKFDWKMIRHLKGLKRPVFLSGGLTAGNVRKAIRAVHPQWVDVSSSVESRPGKKDYEKVRKFVTAVKTMR